MTGPLPLPTRGMEHPELLTIRADDVELYDHTDEGRMVISAHWEPGLVKITTATPEVVQVVFLNGYPALLDHRYHERQEDDYQPDDELRVIRGMPYPGRPTRIVVAHDPCGTIPE